jgi:hypothetical protein
MLQLPNSCVGIPPTLDDEVDILLSRLRSSQEQMLRRKLEYETRAERDDGARTTLACWVAYCKYQYSRVKFQLNLSTSFRVYIDKLEPAT